MSRINSNLDAYINISSVVGGDENVYNHIPPTIDKWNTNSRTVDVWPRQTGKSTFVCMIGLHRVDFADSNTIIFSPTFELARRHFNRTADQIYDYNVLGSERWVCADVNKLIITHENGCSLYFRSISQLYKSRELGEEVIIFDDFAHVEEKLFSDFREIYEPQDKCVHLITSTSTQYWFENFHRNAFLGTLPYKYN